MKKFLRALVEYWFIWLSFGALIFLLILTSVQLNFFKGFEECNKFIVWTRIFLIVFPCFVILMVVAFAIYELLPHSPMVHFLGESPEESSRRIGSNVGIVGGIITTFLLARWRRKNLPLPKIKFIDNALDKIFGKKEDKDANKECNDD